ncbi:MAG TPA: cellulose binding domain-containing protein, partial [Streptosporangiaceae bacterium]|nr:cellulose binding domain-containing protein [Streptosporangiaceae bacterium]
MRRLGAARTRPTLRGAVVPAIAVLAGASLAAAVASAATAASGRTAVPAAGLAAPAAAAAVCQVTYTVNSDWGTGFSIAVNITNNGPAITSWTLGYAYTGNQKIAQGWSGN